MPVRYQLVINAIDPEPQARFWAAALGYELEPPPAGFATWRELWLSRGIPEEEAGGRSGLNRRPGRRRAADLVPARARRKDDHQPAAPRYPTPAALRTDPLVDRRRRVDAEARRLACLGATQLAVYSEEGVDHYAVAMKDPEGNEFDIN